MQSIISLSDARKIIDQDIRTDYGPRSVAEALGNMSEAGFVIITDKVMTPRFIKRLQNQLLANAKKK